MIRIYTNLVARCIDEYIIFRRYVCILDKDYLSRTMGHVLCVNIIKNISNEFT